MQAWIDGQPGDALGLGNRGLAYGDGLFETIAVRSGRPTLFDLHLRRLARGCEVLKLNIDAGLVRQEILAFAHAMGEGVLKLIVTRGDGSRGYLGDPASPARRILQASPLPAYPSEHYERGIELFPCVTRLSEQPLLAGLKHLNRLEQVLARSEWSSAAYAEGLVLDAAGRVVEGVFSNLFLVRNGALFTADLSRCGVAGTLRAALLEWAAGAGMDVKITDLFPQDLAGAEEVFVCNSLYGVWPVRACGALCWPVGPHTRKLQRVAQGLLDT